jgi:hypothetical protein
MIDKFSTLSDADILENDILERYPRVLDILLYDHTTGKNLIWATDNYQEHGKGYMFDDHILPEKVTGVNGHVIMPRIKKEKALQQERSKNMAEVFTPSWVCNSQNNLIDHDWFGRENVFNSEEITEEGMRTWKTITEVITYPEGKTWKDYLREKRIEITCGEAPYITSRYDTTTGVFIEITNRIGLLDRKLRVINENVHESGAWLEASQTAYKSIYAYEWQGDSLLLAREAMLFTFIENYYWKFGKAPLLKSIEYIAYIISWNAWQMDGLKGVIPNSCKETNNTVEDLFGEIERQKVKCEGCLKDNIYKHNGKYTLIKDWSNKDLLSGKKGRKIRFIDLIK